MSSVPCGTVEDGITVGRGNSKEIDDLFGGRSQHGTTIIIIIEPIKILICFQFDQQTQWVFHII